MRLFGSLGLLVFHPLFLYKLKQGNQTKKKVRGLYLDPGRTVLYSVPLLVMYSSSWPPTRSQDTNGSENPTQLVFFL